MDEQVPRTLHKHSASSCPSTPQATLSSYSLLERRVPNPAWASLSSPMSTEWVGEPGNHCQPLLHGHSAFPNPGHPARILLLEGLVPAPSGCRSYAGTVSPSLGQLILPNSAGITKQKTLLLPLTNDQTGCREQWADPEVPVWFRSEHRGAGALEPRIPAGSAPLAVGKAITLSEPPRPFSRSDFPLGLVGAVR